MGPIFSTHPNLMELNLRMPTGLPNPNQNRVRIGKTEPFRVSEPEVLPVNTLISTKQKMKTQHVYSILSTVLTLTSQALFGHALDFKAITELWLPAISFNKKVNYKF